MMTVAMKVKDTCCLEGELTNLDSVLKSRVITLLTKVCIVNAMAFPIVIYGCWCWTIKKAECQRCFQAVVLEKTLESPLTARRSNQSILQEISPENSLEGLMLKLKYQYLDHLMQSQLVEKPGCWEKLKAKGEGSGRR